MSRFIVFCTILSLILSACAPAAVATTASQSLELVAADVAGFYQFTIDGVRYYVAASDLGGLKAAIENVGTTVATWYLVHSAEAAGIPLFSSITATTGVLSGSVLAIDLAYQTPIGIMILSQLAQVSDTARSLNEQTERVRFEASATIVGGYDLVVVDSNNQEVARYPCDLINQALGKGLTAKAMEGENVIVLQAQAGVSAPAGMDLGGGGTPGNSAGKNPFKPENDKDKCQEFAGTADIVQFYTNLQTTTPFIVINARQSTTVVRLFEGIVYLAQQYKQRPGAWKYGEIELRQFLEGIDTGNARGSFLPGRISSLFTYAFGREPKVKNFTTLNDEQLMTHIGWDGNCK
jgi:hypothetical protein